MGYYQLPQRQKQSRKGGIIAIQSVGFVENGILKKGSPQLLGKSKCDLSEASDKDWLPIGIFILTLE